MSGSQGQTNEKLYKKFSQLSALHVPNFKAFSSFHRPSLDNVTKLRTVFIKGPIKITLNYISITKSTRFIVALSLKFVFRKGDSWFYSKKL